MTNKSKIYDNFLRKANEIYNNGNYKAADYAIMRRFSAIAFLIFLEEEKNDKRRN